MPIDFNKPVITGNYSSDVLQPIKDGFAALARWLDPSSSGSLTGTPTGAKRLNSGALEEFNGTSWAKKPINGLSYDGTNSTLAGTLTVNGDGRLVNQHNVDAATGWSGRMLSKNSTTDRAVFIGTYAGNAVVGANNNALSSWVSLYVNCVDDSNGGSVYMTSNVFMGGNKALHAGNYASYTIGKNSSGNWAPGGWLQFDGTYGLHWPPATSGAGTHIQPADGTFGSFRMNGNKNGYWGLMFPTGDGIAGWMTDGGTAGYYCEGVGWKYYHNVNGFFVSGSAAGGTLYPVVTALSASRTEWKTNYDTYVVAGQLGWNAYGNSHTVFDASAGTTPSGTECNLKDSQDAWSISYPSLMGWNGVRTYGVRVDSARASDNGNPVGTVIHVAYGSVPTGYLHCSGAAVSRTTYATLFATIGTTYGAGDGSTTFNVPDLRGVFIRGLDSGRGVDYGRTIGTYQADDLASHKHTIEVKTGYYNDTPGTNATTGTGPSRATMGYWDTGTTGGTETRPKNVALLPCIKY